MSHKPADLISAVAGTSPATAGNPSEGFSSALSGSGVDVATDAPTVAEVQVTADDLARLRDVSRRSVTSHLPPDWPAACSQPYSW